MIIGHLTACDVLKSAKRIYSYSNPSKLSHEECEILIDDLFEMIEELHGMAERMEKRLIEYHNFASDIRDNVSDLLND